MIYNFIKFYVLSLYHAIFSSTTAGMIYFPALILLVSLFYNRFRLSSLKSKIKKIAKPLLCASLQSFAAPMILGVVVARALQGAAWNSIPVIADQLHCVLIIIFSIIYSRLKLSRGLSIAYGTLLVIFSVRIVGEIISGLLSIYPSTQNDLMSDFILTLKVVLPIALVLTIIQTIILIRTIADYNKITFFISLFLSNAGAFFIAKLALQLFAFKI